MAVLLGKGGRNRKSNLMKAYMPYAYLHTLLALCFSQSPMEEAPVSVSQPSPPPLFHCSFIPRSLRLLDPKNRCKKKQVFFVKQPAEREKTHREGERSGGSKPSPGACEDSMPGGLYPLQVFDNITSDLPRVDIQLVLGPWLQTNCCSRGFVKEMSVLSVEGLELIWWGMCTLGAERRTSVFSGMAPFVTILGLISICKRDNCSHMEAIDRRGQCNFFHEGGQGRKTLMP